MTVAMIVRALLYILLAPFIGATLSGLDRVFSARMQGRVGPPIIQPLYDVNKLLHKQTTVVNSIQVLFVTVYLVFTIFTGTLFFAGGDMLLVFFAVSGEVRVLMLPSFASALQMIFFLSPSALLWFWHQAIA